MAFDRESKLDLRAAAPHIPGSGDVRAKKMRLGRMARKGVKARNGQRVHLEHLRVGGQLVTSVEAIQRFFDHLNAADAEHFTRDDTGATASERHAFHSEHEAAGEELARLGV